MRNIKEYKKTYIFVAITIVILILIGICVLAINGKDNTSQRLRGVIACKDNETDIIDNLFIKGKKDSYLINKDAFENISLEYFDNGDWIILRNKEHQFEINLQSGTFRMDLTEISDDSKYQRPVEIDDTWFVDTDYVFDAFGYTTDYLVSGDKKTVKLYLKQDADNVYNEIHLVNKEETEPETVKETEVEEQYILDEDKVQRPAEELPTVPMPTESPGNNETAAETSAASDNSVLEEQTEAETIEETTPAVNNNNVSYSSEDGRVGRNPNRVNKKTDEEFKAIWNTEKNALTNIFSSGIPNGDNKAVDVRNDTMIAFNPMHGGVYYDTICVSSDTLDGLFISAEFSSDWSDLANNTIIESTKNYYNGIPATMSATLNTILGAEEGTLLFNYIKEHADKTITGGYIYSFDSNGNLKNEYSETKIEGDGIKASELDFTNWQNRTTADGLRYSVSRLGDGFKVEVYKD